MSAIDSETYFYEPQSGHGLKADPFKAVVCPRPIGWISSRSKSGTANLAPYSFFNAVSDAPPTVAFASDGWKNTVSNVAETGEFAFNFVNRDLVDKMNQTSMLHPREVDEFAAAGIESVRCLTIDVPRVKDSPAVLECKLLQIVELKDLSGAQTLYKLVIGQVTGVHLAKRHLRDGLFHTAEAHPIMRAGYRGQYFTVSPEQEVTITRPIGSY